MNESYDPLEAELAALRPQEPSPDLSDRIARQLTDLPVTRSRWLWGMVLTGGLAACCVIAVLWRGRGSDPGAETTKAGGTPNPLPSVLAGADTSPTLLAYTQALARSPEELDALLDRHARQAPERLRIPAFTHTETDLQTWIGEH